MSAEAAKIRWKKVKAIFHEAMRREPAEREAFLDESCDGDPHLRIEVESLLVSLDEAETFLEEPIVFASSDAGNRWQFSNDEVISHYRIVEPIGAGGMAEVYLAEDEKLHRQVALKVLPSEVLWDADRLRRFKREAMAVSALNHPNILTIFEFDSVNGISVLASEYVKGKTLRDTLREGRVRISDTLDIATQVASALQTAHTAGVVHRDIKPENIMIRDDGYVKVLDFGLAKLTGNMRSRETERTHTQAFSLPGLIMGTATYMSPEQARSASIDCRTDIFSFGVLLYEMLAGQVPFAGDTTTDIIAQIIQNDPEPPSSRNPAVSAALDRIVMKCLEKQTRDRYASASDLLADLRALPKPVFENPLAPSTESIGTETFLVEPGERDQSPATGGKGYKPALMGAGVVLILGLVAASYWYLSRDTQSRDTQIDSIAVLPFENQSGSADIDYLSDGMTESLINALSTLPNLSVKARNTVFRYKGAAIDEKKVGQELAVQALLIGWVTQRGDNLTLHLSLVDVATGKNLWGEQYDRKMQDLAILQREITRDVSQKLQTRLSNTDASNLTKNYTANSEAYQQYLRGRYFWNKRTPDSIAKSIEYFDAAIAKDSGFALAYAGLADSYVVPMNEMAPRYSMPKAKAAAMRALQIDDSLAEAHTSLARVLQFYEWNWTEAEREFKRAIELNPRYAVAHQWYGGYFASIGHREEAVEERRTALELDPLSTPVNFDLGQAFYFRREYDKALEQFRKTLELDPSFPSAILYIPLVYSQKGMHEEAIGSVRQVPESSVGTAVLGYVLAAGGREAEARQELAELKRLRDQEYVSAVLIAYVHAGLGEKDEALAWLEKGYEERAHHMLYLKVEPRWDALRNDPRFIEVLRRVGFPE
jgi:eukaryotic-like serine/threonine-protein kinase